MGKFVEWSLLSGTGLALSESSLPGCGVPFLGEAMVSLHRSP